GAKSPIAPRTVERPAPRRGSLERRAGAAPRGRGLGVSPGRAGGGTGELGTRFRDLRDPPRARHAAPAGGRARREGPPLRLRVVLFGVRRHDRSADARAELAPPDLTLRRQQARRRASLLALLAELRATDRIAPLLHRLRS